MLLLISQYFVYNFQIYNFLFRWDTYLAVFYLIFINYY